MKIQSIKINDRNPGHFFACCGILYCVDRMFTEAYGYFKDDKFVIQAECDKDPISEILKKLSNAESTITKDTEESDSPLYIESIPIRLDFYNHFDNRPRIKLFSGQQKIHDIIKRWLDHITEYDGGPVKDLKDQEEIDVPSGFDSGTSWNSLDVGFSLNVQRMKRRSYPLVEFFAHIGIQTYSWSKDEYAYRYRTWNEPLPITVARAVASGAVIIKNTKCFQFKTQKSGQTQILNSAQEVNNTI